MESNTIKILDFPDHLAKVFGAMLETKVNSDVVFVVNGTRFPAHRQIIAAHSKFFQTLLFNNRFKEGNQSDIPLKVPLKAFELLLAYFYTGKVNLTMDSLKTTMELYELAHRYEVTLLEEKLRGELASKLTVDGIFDFLNFIALFRQFELETKCFEFIDENAQEIIQRGEFLAVNAKQLKTILERQTLKVTTIQKFEALDKWIKHNKIAQTITRKEFLGLIDISKLSNAQILTIVAPTNLYDSNFVLSELASRKSDVPEEQIAPVSLAKFFEPECSGERTLYSARGELERGSWVDGKLRAVFNMGTTCVVNFTNIKLGPANSYKFTIEVSIDNVNWEKIYKREVNQFSSDIDIFIAPRPVKYFRISGDFEVVSFKTGYYGNLKFIDGVLVPPFNLNSSKFLWCSGGSASRDVLEMWIESPAREKSIYLDQPLWLRYIRFYGCRFRDYMGCNELTVTVIGENNTAVFVQSINLSNTNFYYFTFPPEVVTAFVFSLNREYKKGGLWLKCFDTGL